MTAITKNAKSNQNNEWHLIDYSGLNVLPYEKIRIKKD